MQRLDLRTLRRPTEFYFVRHGESEGNRAGKILGRMDLGLSDSGRDHARAAGRFFAEEISSGVDVYVTTSPLTRCRETATLIAEEAGLPAPVPRAELVELDAGVFAGRRLGEIAREMPAAFGRFRVHSWEVVEGAERIDSLYSRAVAAWNHLIERSNAGAAAVIAVTHAGFMQWLLKATFAGPDQAWMPVIKATNCGIFHCHVEPTSYEDGNGAPRGAPGGAPGAPPPDPGRRVSGIADGFFAEWRRIDYVPY
ncbi:MAG: histidine phosphatase family protein [bacterium]